MAIKNPYSPIGVPATWQGPMRRYGVKLAESLTDLYMRVMKLEKSKTKVITDKVTWSSNTDEENSTKVVKRSGDSTYLRMSIRPKAAGSGWVTYATLPVGSRPTSNMYFPCCTSAASPTVKLASITTAGAVRIRDATAQGYYFDMTFTI